MVRITYHGDLKRTDKFLRFLLKPQFERILEKYGNKGVTALEEATPLDSGLTAASWYYEIEETSDGPKIIWKNSNLGQGWAPIAILLQMGHGTRNGGYVEGRDYINPAMAPIFDKIAEDAWQEVSNH